MERSPLVCLLGKSGSGKDTAGAWLAEAGNGVCLAFADKLKSICGEMFGLSREDLYTAEGKERPTAFDCLRCPTCHSLEIEPMVMEQARSPKMLACKLCGATGDPKVFASKWTPRMIAQFIGTEGFRRVNPYVWPDYAIRLAQRYLSRDGKALVIITDGRFRSECERIWKIGGEVWRIRRPERDGAVGIKAHASETEQDSIKDGECQAVIENDGSLDTFKGRVLAQLARYGESRIPA